MTIGQNIKNQRKKAKLTQTKTAIELETDQTQISRIENDKAEFTMLQLKKFCELTNSSADKILEIKTYKQN
jgi:transcriptional regulator with XRE-family HTH domain